MKIDNKNAIIEDQAHKMWAEGIEDEQPTKEDIIKYLKDNGWNCSNINIFFDDSQYCWRWSCDIHK